MEEEYKPKVDHHTLKIMKEVSRKLNVIPPNKTISLKNRYKRRKKNTRQYLEEVEEEVV